MNKIMKCTLFCLFVIGAATALLKVFFWGESVVNYGAYTPWGLWVGLYILLVGTAAGAAWVGIYAAYQSDSIPRLTSISLAAAGISLAFGMGFIGMDLGKPMNGIMIFLSPDFSSKLTIASWLYIVFFISLAGFFFTNAKRACLYLSGIAAVCYLLAESLFFSGMVARELWYSLLTPISFFTSAILSGSALVAIITWVVDEELSTETQNKLKKVLLYSLIAHVAVEIVHLVAGSGGKAELIYNQWASWPFWGLFLIIGALVPAFLMIKGTRSLAIPSVLIFLGVAAYKYSFVRYGFSIEPLAGLTSAFEHAKLTLNYTPSIVEWIIAVGFLSGLFWVASQVVPRLLAPGQVWGSMGKEVKQ